MLLIQLLYQSNYVTITFYLVITLVYIYEEIGISVLVGILIIILSIL